MHRKALFGIQVHYAGEYYTLNVIMLPQSPAYYTVICEAFGCL